MPYDPSWDAPHKPGPQALWQESDCYWFYDVSQGVGGFHRIGQHPNLGVGQVMLFAFDARGQRFRSVRNFPVSPQSRWETGQRVGSSTTEFLGDERVNWKWSEAACEADLKFDKGFYTPRDWSKLKRGHDVLKDMNADGHLECSGLLSGALRIGDKTYKLNALAHRDRSWGARDHNVLGQHRMFSGTVGPAFSIASFTFQTRDGLRQSTGFVVRDGKEEEIVGLRVPTTFDDDGHTTLGATASVTLQSGEIISIAARSVQGFMTNVENICFSTDTLSTIQMDGQTGFVDVEITNNPMRGAILPKQQDFSFVAVEEGLSDSAVYRS